MTEKYPNAGQNLQQHIMKIQMKLWKTANFGKSGPDSRFMVLGISKPLDESKLNIENPKSCLH